MPCTWTCNHSPDTKTRCAKCSSDRGLTKVVRRAAGGSPRAQRYLCGACYEVYDAAGLIDSDATEGPSKFARSSR